MVNSQLFYNPDKTQTVEQTHPPSEISCFDSLAAAGYWLSPSPNEQLRGARTIPKQRIQAPKQMVINAYR